MKSNFEAVCIFNKSFGLPHFDSKQEDILTTNQKLSNLRINLCIEEAEELEDAFIDNNLIEIIDALTDELYVLYGAGSSFGVNLDKKFVSKMFDIYYGKGKNNNFDFMNEILNYSNYDMLKYILIENKHEHLFTYKRCNIINYDNIFSETFKKSEEYENCRIILDELRNNIKRNISKLEEEKNKFIFDNVINCLTDILYDTYKLGIFLGINLDKSFDIVHNSNMSKLCKNEDEAQKTVEWYKNNDDRYKTPEYRLSDDKKYWVVFNKDSGKILKSINYTPADFKQLF